MSGICVNALTSMVENYRGDQSLASKLFVDECVVDILSAIQMQIRESGYFTQIGFEFGLGADASLFGTIGGGFSASSGGDGLDIDGALQLVGSRFGQSNRTCGCTAARR